MGLAERSQVTGGPVIVVVSHTVDDHLADLMDYARITAAFVDVFEWFAGTDSGYLVNVETAALVAPGYLSKVEYWLRDVDSMSSRFRVCTSPISAGVRTGACVPICRSWSIYSG